MRCPKHILSLNILLLGRLVKAVQKCLHDVQFFDINNEPASSQDILDPKCEKRIKNVIADNNCMGVWFGMPCGSCSSARRCDGKAPKPLPSHHFDDLKGDDLLRVNAANSPVEVM